MEIRLDPADERKFKLIKRPSNLWIVIVVILVAGVVFAMISQNLVIFTPFLVIMGLVYIFSGNSFEIGVDQRDKTIYRKSNDLLNIVQFYNRIKIDEVQKICIASQFLGEKHVSDRLILVLRNEERTALCSVSYEPDYDAMLRFTRALAQVLNKEYESYPEYKG